MNPFMVYNNWIAYGFRIIDDTSVFVWSMPVLKRTDTDVLIGEPRNTNVWTMDYVSKFLGTYLVKSGWSMDEFDPNDPL